MSFPDTPTHPDIQPSEKIAPERTERDRLAYVCLAVGLLGAPAPIYWAATLHGWQFAALGGGFGALALAGIVAFFLSHSGRRTAATWSLMVGVAVLGLSLAVAINQLGALTAIGVMILFPALARDRFSGRMVQVALSFAVVVASAALLIDLFDVFPALPQPVSAPVLLVIDALALGALGLIVARQFQAYSLRTKLILTFLAIALVPVSLLTFLSAQSTQTALRNEANQKLGAAASQTAAVLNAFIQSNLTNVNTQAQISTIVDYMSASEAERADPTRQEEVRRLLLLLAKEDPINVRLLGLLDTQGHNILDVTARMTGEDESDRDYFTQASANRVPFVSPIEFSPSDGRPAIFFSSPIFDARSRVVGVIRVGFSAAVIQNIIDHSAGLAGPGSYAVVFDEYFLNVAHSNQPDMMLNPVGPITTNTTNELVAAHRLPTALANGPDLKGLQPSLVDHLRSADRHPYFEAADPASPGSSDRVAVTRMTGLPWLVAFFQPQDTLFAPARAQTNNAILLAVLVAIGVTLGAIMVSRFLADPIIDLTKVAKRVGEGDLAAQAEVTAQDEIGVLGRTFNAMSQRMQGLVSGLEERVAERTSDLERRALQLQAASEVARDAAGILDVDELLSEAVRLISERFGFYHAGVFMIDESGENATLRAASSEGGRRMLARGHSLAVGKVGIVGYVTGAGRPRIALDVGEDAVHFANPDLPKTRSEMALPLMTGDRVIGALDVQSVEPNAFDEDDLLALQTMADQLTIAIQNASLLSRETELAAQRRRALDIYRQLTQQFGYDQIIADVTRLVRGAYGYERVTLGMVEGGEIVVRSASARSQDRLPHLGQGVPFGQGLMGIAAEQRQPVRMSRSRLAETLTEDPVLGTLGSSLAVPLISRGEVIGVLTAESERDITPSDDEVELLELLASQVAVSIENARLFEETQQSLRQVNLLYRRQTAEAWETLLSNRRTQGQETTAAFGDEESPTDKPSIELPIALRGEIIGRMDILPPDLGKWSDEDREILTAVADEVADQLEQLRMMEEIQRRATQMETAADIARVATGLLDLDGLLERAVHLIQERFGYYNVSLYLVDRTGHSANLRQSAGHAEQALLSEKPSVELGERSILGFVTESGEYYVAHDVSTDPYFKSSPLLPDTRSQLAVPLRAGEQVIGALDVQDTGLYAFSEDDIAVLETLADQLAVAVQNARSYEDALRRAEREQKVLEISSRIRSSADIDSMLRTAVSEIKQAIGAKRAAIRLSSASGSSGIDEPDLPNTRNDDPANSKSDGNGASA
jgi:GAF domain-containing protein/HAMP domain-containing protein